MLKPVVVVRDEKTRHKPPPTLSPEAKPTGSGAADAKLTAVLSKELHFTASEAKDATNQHLGF